MKAITHDRYGPVETLESREVERPAIGDDDVLVRVRAAGLHIGDVYAVKGSPLPMRLATGLLRPRQGIPGFDLAGVVEAVGSNVTRFRPGDEVFGVGDGTAAEYARASASKLALKPARLTFEEAASIPTSGLAALQGLRDAAGLRTGQKILINGASGGVGTFAVQIARATGAEVTGVASTPNLEMVRSIGADRVVDYTREDFTRGAQRYDVIFDNIENRSLSDVRRLLTPDGTLVLNSGTGAKGLAMMVRLVRPLLISPFVGQTLRRFLSSANHEDLEVLKGMVESGRLRPVIDRTYPLPQTGDALRHIESGHVRGKVVVAVA